MACLESITYTFREYFPTDDQRAKKITWEMITFEIAILRRRLQGQEKGLCLVQRRLWEAAFLFQELGHSEVSITSSVI